MQAQHSSSTGTGPKELLERLREGPGRLTRGLAWLRDLPRRAVYPVAAVVLAQGAPLALLLTRAYEDDLLHFASVRAGPSAQWAWFVAELSADRTAYVWLIVSSTVLMASLGALLGSQEDRLRQLATFDSLTGLMNRRTFSARLHQELARAQRYSRSLSLLIIDLDWLKSINDRHGHSAGDRAIRAVAHSLKSSLRSTDLTARYAGDEFVALLPETQAHEAVHLARRVGARVSESALGPSGAHLSVSIGVADLETAEAQTAEDLFVAADEALYRAKAAGRNNVALAEAVPPSFSRAEGGH
jgi:diguanylate cyclase (GGDEF)-like protein